MPTAAPGSASGRSEKKVFYLMIRLQSNVHTPEPGATRSGPAAPMRVPGPARPRN
jgi:hypothetical protein